MEKRDRAPREPVPRGAERKERPRPRKQKKRETQTYKSLFLGKEVGESVEEAGSKNDPEGSRLSGR